MTEATDVYRIEVLTKAKHFNFIRSVLTRAKLVETLDQLTGDGCLMTYSTGLVVPEEIFSKFSVRYNFHPGTPQYPGRDPHHWACWDGATTFGATAHLIMKRVDTGPIVGLAYVGIPKDSAPERYREAGERALQGLFVMLAPVMEEEGTPAIKSEWTGTKRTRADLIKMCDFTGLTADQIEDRKLAFAGFEKCFRRGPSNVEC